jgi:hypothetical protein
MIGTVLIFAAGSLVILLLWRARRRRPPPRRSSKARTLKRGPGSFEARAWPSAVGEAPPRDIHRPAEIQGSDPRILPPPRMTRGEYGE